MTFLRSVLAVAIGGCVLLAAPAGRAAAVDYFLKIEGIDGESKAQGHQNWLEVTSIAWGRGAPQGVAEGGMAGRSGAGDARSASGPGQMTITKTLDKASPKLMQAMTSGRHIPSAQLDLAKPGAPAMRYDFQNVIISSYKQTAGQGGQPVEQFTINFEKVEMTRSGGPGWACAHQAGRHDARAPEAGNAAGREDAGAAGQAATGPTAIGDAAPGRRPAPSLRRGGAVIASDEVIGEPL